tara:strand:- start:437 stop:694 length:258 start_codon:yes stop_codon:yes gene_type:complete
MRSDSFYLTRYAMRQGAVSKRPVTIDIICRMKIRRNRDRDNLIAGLKWAFDGIAQSLGLDDSHFQFGDVSFETGDVEETEITVQT